jgi:hypothetical protein
MNETIIAAQPGWYLVELTNEGVTVRRPIIGWRVTEGITVPVVAWFAYGDAPFVIEEQRGKDGSTYYADNMWRQTDDAREAVKWMQSVAEGWENPTP